ncbi:MAG: MBL fold metallo-hydrolase [Candidatus Omnitrophota bacterium]
MRISFMGHACFLLETARGTKIITDPYEPGSYQGALKYAPVNIDADIVTVSHKHPDHNFTKEFRKAKIYDHSGSWSIYDVEIKGILSYHDNQKGKARGSNIIFVISADGMRIAHFGDLGTTDIDYGSIGQIDVALIPVGTIFTIDAEEIARLNKTLNPRICIPMHFKTSRCEFNIATVDDFITGKPDIQHCETLELSSQNIGSFSSIVVLEHMR